MRTFESYDRLIDIKSIHATHAAQAKNWIHNPKLTHSGSGSNWWPIGRPNRMGKCGRQMAGKFIKQRKQP